MKRITLLVVVAALCCTAKGADKVDFDKPAIGVIGFDLPTLTDEQKKDGLKWPTQKGVFVSNVWKDGPADKAGLKRLDIIQAFGGTRVGSLAELSGAVTGREADTSTISFYRPSEAKGGLRWRRQSAKITPTPWRELLAKQIERSVDEATGHITYRHRDTPEAVNKESSVDIYVVDDGGEHPKLCMRITYVADDWLFISGYTFVGGVERCAITPPPNSVDRDHEGSIWEWYTATAEVRDDKSEVMIAAKTIAENGGVKIFYQGDKYRKEREITPAEQARISMLLQYIEAHPDLKE